MKSWKEENPEIYAKMKLSREISKLRRLVIVDESKRSELEKLVEQRKAPTVK